MANRTSWRCFVQRSRMAAAFVLMLLSCTTAAANPITPGNLVLTRVAGGAGGNASVALSGANKVFLEEYTTAGVFVQSIPVSSTAATSGQRAATLAGTANTEGHITLSMDGRYMVYGGYNQTELGTSPNSSPSNTVERVVARLELSTGNVD